MQLMYKLDIELNGGTRSFGIVKQDTTDDKAFRGYAEGVEVAINALESKQDREKLLRSLAERELIVHL